MRSSIRLDSAVFQLTPTRTRCDLVISANGKTEKLATGLLNPFLAHLTAAQEQMAKGGYSIILEPKPGSDTSWFTKGTVERFVRFVSTPEVLERVHTLESEILQIEEAIAIQGNSETALSAVEDSPVKLMESNEGSRISPDTSDEKAIVLYKPGANQPESNGSASKGGNSKVQLLKVLETRKTVLQKEQGMAFARAVAAGFDIDNISQLMSFSECFGASRLRDACKRFKELWKKKHETGQWVEIEAAEAMSNRSDFSTMNASGIMLSSVANAELSSESNGKPANADEKASLEQQPPQVHPEYFQGQFPHQMFPPWPMQSPPGTVPVFQPYPMQGMPYYQNYPGAGPFFQPPYAAPVDDPRVNSGLRMGQKRHSMDSSNGNTEPEAWEIDAHRTRSLDEAEFERESRKKGSRSSKKKPGVVVIRNINYITSKGQNHSDEESQSASESEADEDDGSASSETKRNNSLRSSKKKDNHIEPQANLTPAEEVDGGHWEVFQNFLLRDADNDKHSSDQGMFSTENKVHSKRRQDKARGDPILFGGPDSSESQNGRMDMQDLSGNMTRMRRTSADEAMISKKDGLNGALDGQGDVLSSEINGRRLGYRRSSNDDFVIDRQSGYTGSSSDPLDINGFDGTRNNADQSLSNNMDDDSYIVSLRSTSLGGNRNAVDMDSEFASANKKAETRAGNQVNYEPEELSMMPRRGAENVTTGYDLALDYEMEDGASRSKKNKESVTEAQQGSKKLPDKGQRSKLLQDDKKKNVGPIRRGKPSKLSPLDEARARAEKLRTYKADLQKMKKEKEEAEMKRLEALKMQRQKRIAARGGSTIPAQPTRKQVPTRTSLSSLRGSKFSDSEPGSTSPLQRFPARTASFGSSDSQKASKTSRLSGALSDGNRLIRSATSLPAQKKGSNGVASETKAASMARIRRLSEPKISNHPISSLRAETTKPVSKSKASDGTEVKKLSAIVNYDKSKAATLPELKIRTTKGSDPAQSKSTTKEAPQKGNSVKSSTTSEVAEPKKNDGKFPYNSEGDENPIVEKTVLMLEEKPQAPAVRVSEGNSRADSKQNENFKISENTTGVSVNSVIQAPASKIVTDIVSETESQTKKQNTSYEAATSTAKDIPSANVAESSYQAPYARTSSFEDPCTENSEYGKAAPTNLEPGVTSSTSIRAQVFDSRGLKLEKIPEVIEKPHGKESAKGFRRLLKFGRKSNGSGSGEPNTESDNTSLTGSDADDNGANTVASGEVHTLKNLISQDETPTAEATTHKASRHFSLLSPFRSKTSEKKSTA